MYNFTVAAALKLFREQDINVLQGCPKVTSITVTMLKVATEIEAVKKSLQADSTEKVLAEGMRIFENLNNQYITLANEYHMEKINYYSELIPYFLVSDTKKLESFTEDDYLVFEAALTIGVKSTFPSKYTSDKKDDDTGK